MLKLMQTNMEHLRWTWASGKAMSGFANVDIAKIVDDKYFW